MHIFWMSFSKVHNFVDYFMDNTTPNIVIFFQSTECALERSLQNKIRSFKATWKELQDTIQNLKAETNDTFFRVRGGAARRADKITFWRKVGA